MAEDQAENLRKKAAAAKKKKKAAAEKAAAEKAAAEKAAAEKAAKATKAATENKFKFKRKPVGSDAKDGDTEKLDPMFGAKHATRVITVTSGKGGVGKTNIAVNLAIALQLMNKRTLLIDADIGMANVDVILGNISHRNMLDLLETRIKLSDVIINSSFGISYISGSSSADKAVGFTKDEQKILYKTRGYNIDRHGRGAGAKRARLHQGGGRNASRDDERADIDLGCIRRDQSLQQELEQEEFAAGRQSRRGHQRERRGDDEVARDGEAISEYADRVRGICV